jgi:hypothetical protein
MKKITVIYLILIILLFTTSISADQIELTNGESYRGEVENSSIMIRTSYAELSIQTQYLNKIDREGETFTLRASENNRFSGEILNNISFSTNGDQRNFTPSEISSIDFSNNDSFNNNRKVTISLKNGDFFFANTVEDSISVETSLGSPLNIRYDNILSIEYLNEEDSYLIRKRGSSEVNVDFAQQRIIVWPAAGDIFELELEYITSMNFN